MFEEALSVFDGTRNEAKKKASFCNEIERMQQNLAGYVVRGYAMPEDVSCWIFGSSKWCLLDREDDPLRWALEPVPLKEFLHYLEDWYWPTTRMLAATSSEIGHG